jgi:hypothetical protein
MCQNLPVSLPNVKNISFQAWTVRRAVLGSDLSPIQRLVALVLLEHVDAAGTCWPSLGTISRESGLGKSAICDALAALEGAGWVTRTRRFSPGGDPTSTLYRFAPRPAPEARKPPVRPAIQVVRQPYNPCPQAGHNPIRGNTHTDPDRVYARDPERRGEARAKALPLAPRAPGVSTSTPTPRAKNTTPGAPIRIVVPPPKAFLEGAAALLAVLKAPTNVARDTTRNLTGGGAL